MKTELKKTNSTRKINDTLFPYQIPRLVGRNVDLPPHVEWSPRQFCLTLERQISSSDIWFFSLCVPVSLCVYVFAYALKQSLNETFETIRNDYFRRKRVLGEEFHFYFIINFKSSRKNMYCFCSNFRSMQWIHSVLESTFSVLWQLLDMDFIVELLLIVLTLCPVKKRKSRGESCCWHVSCLPTGGFLFTNRDTLSLKRQP